MRAHILGLHICLTIALCLPIILVLSGCQYLTTREVEERAEKDRQTANMMAGVYEAASAIEKGAPPGPPLTAIKVSSTTAIQILGYSYPPADAWLRSLEAKSKPMPIPTTGDAP
jgi:hypothetical protein